MSLPIANDTLLTVRLDGEIMGTTTLALFLVDNFDSDLDAAAIHHTLSRGEVYKGGGGAQPVWSLERA